MGSYLNRETLRKHQIFPSTLGKSSNEYRKKPMSFFTSEVIKFKVKHLFHHVIVFFTVNFLTSLLGALYYNF